MKFVAVIAVTLGLHALIFVGLGRLEKIENKAQPKAVAAAPVAQPKPMAAPAAPSVSEPREEPSMVPAASLAGVFARKPPAKKVRPVVQAPIVDHAEIAAQPAPAVPVPAQAQAQAKKPALPVFDVNTGSENVETQP